MIFDELGLPRPTGATDFQDSSALAGIMAVFKWPQKVNLLHYIEMNSEGWKYVRHPKETKYDMSRDQAVCLMAGLKAQGRERFVDIDCVVGRDIFSPSVKGHIARCQGGKATWLQDQWLKLDIWWSASVRSNAEINQLLCMLVIAGPKWVKRFTDRHKTWRENLRAYWSGWRGEPTLCEHMILKIEGMI